MSVTDDATLSGLVTSIATEAPTGRIRFGGESLTYQDLPGRVARRAAAFGRWGVGPGSLVAIHMENSIDWLTSWLAVAWLNADLVPLNTRFSEGEVEYVLRHSRCTHLIWGTRARSGRDLGREDAERLERILRSCPLVTAVAVAGSVVPASPPYVALDELMAADGVPSLEDASASMVQYTSGSTAFPKGAVLANKSLIRNGRGLGTAWRVTAADIALVFNPLFHCGGSVFAFLATYTHGATTILLDRWNVEEAFDLMAATNVTVFPGIDASVRDLLAYARTSGRKLPALRLISTAADSALLGEVSAVLDCEPSNVYGLTESSPNVCVGDLSDSREKRIEVIGRPQPGLEVEIRDPETHRAVGPDVLGVIAVRGWSLMRGYLNDDAATRAAIGEDGFLWTGDLGSLDVEGYLRFRGREKQMIKSGGENISIEEVEAGLRTVPGVADAVVVPAPHPRFGEVPYAFIQTDPGVSLDAEAVISHCRRFMAGFKIPRQFEFDSELPRSGSGKLDRRALAERASGTAVGS